MSPHQLSGIINEAYSTEEEPLEIRHNNVTAVPTERKWVSSFTPFTHHIRKEEKEPELLTTFPPTCSPLQILKSLLTDEIIKIIVDETNKYAGKKEKEKFENCTVDELWSFLALVILMGIVKKPTVKSYWSCDKILETPYFSKIMSRNRSTDEEKPVTYVFLEFLTKMKVVRHLIRPLMIFFPGCNAQGLGSYSKKT